MRLRLVCSIFVLVLVSMTTFDLERSKAQTTEPKTSSEMSPSPAEILDQFVELLGGQMELASRTEYQIDHTVTWSGGSYEWIVKQGGDRRFTTQQGGLGIYHHDGRNRWGSINHKEPTLSDPSTAWQANYSFPHPTTMTRILDLADQFTYEGRITITNPETDEEFDVDQIALVEEKENESGCKILYSFDRESGLLVHVFHQVTDAQQVDGSKNRNCYFRYSEFDGILAYSEYWSEFRDEHLHIKVDKVNWEPEFTDETFEELPASLLNQVAD